MKRPFANWSVHSIDAAGVAAVAGIIVAAYCLAMLPTEQAHRRLVHAQQQQTVLSTQFQALEARLAEVERETASLSEATADRLAVAPRVADLNAILSGIVSTGQQLGLEVHSITPKPAKPQNDYLASEVEIIAAGDPRHFVALLDALARNHPYHAVRTFSVARGPEGDQCVVTLGLELYLLPTHERALQTDEGETA